MKVSIIGSDNLLMLSLDEYIPDSVTEIISGDENAVDTSAIVYAQDNNLDYSVYHPDYERYGGEAPIKKNELMVDISDMVFLFWDGKSDDIVRAIKYAMEKEKKVVTYKAETTEPMGIIARVYNRIFCNVVKSEAIMILYDEFTNCIEEECANYKKIGIDSFDCYIIDPIE